MPAMTSSRTPWAGLACAIAGSIAFSGKAIIVKLAEKLRDWEPDQPVVLDVREPAELQTASVQPDGFTLLTIPMGAVPARLSELDPRQPVACLCHHGGRSMQVASFLLGCHSVSNCDCKYSDLS
mgnify:CR=1 FL=1